MKITVDIDCTAKEARDFLGLPNIKPVQEAFIAQMKEKMAAGLSSNDMEKMYNLWMTPIFNATGENMGKNMDVFQNLFWNVATSNKNPNKK